MLTLRMHVLSFCCRQQDNFFIFFTYDRADLSVKLTLCALTADQIHVILHFSLGSNANWELAYAVIILKFCMTLGPTEANKITCATAHNNVSIPNYGGGGGGSLPQKFKRLSLGKYCFDRAAIFISLKCRMLSKNGNHFTPIRWKMKKL